MNKRRLLKLADMLEADAKNKKGVKFDLRVVGVMDEIPPDSIVPLKCGTSACAMGLAAISGAFSRAGLSYRLDGVWIEPTWRGIKVGYDRAATSLFGITDRESDFLFEPSFYPTSKLRGAAGERYVAKRIRDFVAGKVGPEVESA